MTRFLSFLFLCPNMGTRQHKFRCNDCYEKLKEEDTDGWELFEESSFWVDMEHMQRDELLAHLRETECPRCGSKNWTITDDSQI